MSEPMGILRAKKDIEPDTEILTRHWRTTKDAWHNIFECQCCACTNHTGLAPDPPIATVTIVTTISGSPTPTTDHPPRESADPEARVQDDSATSGDSKRDAPKVNVPEYPDSEIDDWNWDELEASPSTGETIPTQSQLNTHPHVLKNGFDSGSILGENRSHAAATLHTMSHPLLGSLLEKIALTPQQSFPVMMPITAGTPITIYTGGHPQRWKASHVGLDSGTSVTLEYENMVITVDKSWVTFDSQV